MWGYEVKIRVDSQFSRMNCQTFSTGFNSGALAGSGTRVMLAGILSRFERCQPAWSSRTTACAPGATASEISARCRAMACAVQRGTTGPATGDLVLLPDPGLVGEPDF